MLIKDKMRIGRSIYRQTNKLTSLVRMFDAMDTEGNHKTHRLLILSKKLLPLFTSVKPETVAGLKLRQSYA